MKAIMVMFDSLNRRMLPPYGCDWTKMPNFQRLAERTVTFDRSYVGSMPCMPARRELHTGRYNFLHRSWGPLEPFDDSMPDLLKHHDVYTHLSSDHYHYWEDGGATYHNRYQSWECVRGHEGDAWVPDLTDTAPIPECVPSQAKRHVRNVDAVNGLQDWINRAHMQNEEDMPQPKTFQNGLEFLDRNHAVDSWFLHIETFDPHEPYFSPERFKELYPEAYDGPEFDWPLYQDVTETPEEVKHCRMRSAALHSMCDHYLGRVLDKMDELGLWEDTMLIVNTDHGFLLGEHDYWAKCHIPMWNEVAHTPLFIWDPRCGKQGEHRQALVQTIDLPATLLEFFGVERPADMQGVPLRGVIENDTPVREGALYGLHGAHVNVTDGRYVYMRAPTSPDNWPLYNYTVMPTRMRGFLPLESLANATLAEPLPFTKGARVMKLPVGGGPGSGNQAAAVQKYGTLLYDLETDPAQETPLQDPALEQRMIDLLVKLMKANDAPEEQFERLGLNGE